MGMSSQCRASLGRTPSCPGVTTSPRLTHTLPAELSPRCSWVHRAHAHITPIPPVYMPGHTHVRHTHSPCHTWWVGPHVRGCLSAREGLGDTPLTAHTNIKALLLLPPAHTRVLGDTHPMAAPQRPPVHPHPCELQFTLTSAPSACP